MFRNFKRGEAKREKRNKIILGIFVTVIMVGSTLGIFMGGGNSSPNGIEYKAKDGETYQFVRGAGKYDTEIGGTESSFYSLPFDAEKANISKNAASLIRDSKTLYITFDPDSKDIQFIEQARFDLSNDLADFNKLLLSGVTKNTTLYKLGVITCDNATGSMPVIYLKESNTTRGYVKNKCLVFEGKRSDFLVFRDWVVYKLYNLI